MKNKILTLLYLLISILIISCNDDTITTNTTSNNVISGKIVNWNLGANYTLVAFIGTLSGIFTDSCEIDNTGNFSIKLNNPPDSTLHLWNLDSSSCTHHTIVNPIDLKYTEISFKVRFDDSIVGVLDERNDTIASGHTGQIIGNIWFVNINGSINGTDSCFYNQFILTSNLSLITGFNTVYMKFNYYSEMYINASLLTEPQQLQWYFRRYY